MEPAPADRFASRVDDLTPQRRELVEQMLRQRARRPLIASIPRRSPSAVAPLSYAQRRMWLLEQLARGTAAHNMDTLVRVRAAFNLTALQSAVNAIIRRHESLRTTFREEDGEPVQVIAPHLELRLAVTDLRNLPIAHRYAHGVRLATEDARQPFDLETGPLVRCKLYRLDDDDYLLLLTLHHIVSDFVSMTVFFDELIGIYESLSAGLSPHLEDVPLQYADYACWQRQSLAADQFDAQLGYWRKQLDGLQPLDLVTDMARPAIGSADGTTCSREVPADVVAGVKALGAAAGVTAFTTFLAAFKVLLHRYTRQTDIAIGVPTAGRGRPELQRVIGFFVNSLVMRTDLGGDPTFGELLRRVERTVAEAMANQDAPFEKLVEDLQPERRLNQNPLFQVSFQLLPLPKAVEAAERIWIDHQTAALDLAVELIDSPEGVTLRADYAATLFRPDTIERMMAQYVALLRAIVADSARPISALTLMSADERVSMIDEWSRPSVETAEQPPLAHELIADRARHTPDAVAIEHGSSRYTYREFEAATVRVAGQLRARGVRERDLVAVAVPSSFDLYTGLVGVLKAGAAYVPIDLGQNERHTDRILTDARPSAILTVASAAPRFTAHPRVVVIDSEGAGCDEVQGGPDRGDPAYVIFTSGSTGRPKGVVVEHHSLANQLRWMQDTFPLTTRDCVLQKYPIAFDAAIIEIFGTLGAGARLVPVERDALADTGRLAELIRAHQVTVLDGVPSLLAMLLDEDGALTGLRRIVTGGEILPPALLERLRETGAAEIANLYGPTEATITATAWIDDGRAHGARVPIGRPVRNMRAYVLDAHMQPVPVGVPGELYVGGAGVARGYLGSLDLTAASFVANPFESALAPRLYRTGDLVRFLPDRNLEYLGRTDRQVKIRGHRIAPEELETTLREHPGVTDAAVFPGTDAGDAGLNAAVAITRALPELWPSVGEYGIYDDLLYHAMTSDGLRNRAYQSAIDRFAPGKVVLDIGTGADMVWARACAEAGARHVFAVEMLPDAAARASQLAASLGLSERITIVSGDSRDLQLPEPVDLIVSEVIGTIASSEGAAPTLNDARRLLRPGGTMIPLRAVTRMAAVELPQTLVDYPTFTAVSAEYVQRVFQQVGRPMDLRLCVKGLTRGNLLTDDAVFEQLDFSEPVALGGQATFALTVQREGSMHGFLLWIQLMPGGEHDIDSMDGNYSWLPVFVPLGGMRLHLRPGDRVTGTAEVSYPDGRAYPDYRIAGSISRVGRDEVTFDLDLPYSSDRFRAQPFYRNLFHGDGTVRRDGLASVPALRAWLSARVPSYMIPDGFALMDGLPRTASGKPDLAAMASTPRSRAVTYVAPRSDIERRTAEAWERVLKRDRVGIHDNFFDVGGHSLLLVRLLRELRLAIAPEATLSDLFQYPTISSLADALHRRRADPVVAG